MPLASPGTKCRTANPGRLAIGGEQYATPRQKVKISRDGRPVVGGRQEAEPACQRCWRGREDV
ncbi:MAG: hypothetical protein DWQ31_13280 [Planctomycetota bacterium]|nr:MAG: hypothetical protein DWQ31_13280 [Planctomycetota bacterium]REJ87106.1 MAG: hypothetical protein DWQ35_22160 [Planctomycetota bacterium]REK26976.1 MAG: hypothetical protein DWQ42_07915 [Planctomycetota bacterium]REK47297.1 MAG: hypothetical protein DWQ46_04695 [Planctomycetota bacterium]